MPFKPHALPTLIGSLPIYDHQEATGIILEYMPEIPLWVQLPVYPEERLLSQFAEGLPGITGQGDDLFFDTSSPGFDQELIAFYEQYLGVTEGAIPIDDSVFAFSEKTGRGFSIFLDSVARTKTRPIALKGQITGPFTMLSSLKDSSGRLAYFNPQLRDAMVKALSLKARYQVEKMKNIVQDVIVFLDEPALSGFGSSAFVGITREDTVNDLSEVAEAVHDAGGIAGIHVCANTDWSMIIDTPVDIISFDAFSYFDRLILFREQLAGFLAEGRILAWGLVPTLKEKDLRDADISMLIQKWEKQTTLLGHDPETIRSQAIITPSCGTGLLSLELSRKALELTRELSRMIRKQS
ncbi:MAG TPA: hypothetical protein EYP57_01430 [Thermodesulfobacteriaceae bacterium]|nr:hypothetical protein [Thermodesulfobacteriaceae bacterium]